MEIERMRDWGVSEEKWKINMADNMAKNKGRYINTAYERTNVWKSFLKNTSGFSLLNYFPVSTFQSHITGVCSQLCGSRVDVLVFIFTSIFIVLGPTSPLIKFVFE